MNIGPLGIIGSIAGSPLAQSKGSEVDRAAHDTSNQARQISAENKAEQAAGIGRTEEDQESSERDADGRRLWEEQAEETSPDETPSHEDAESRRSKDPTGDRGRQLDLSG